MKDSGLSDTILKRVADRVTRDHESLTAFPEDVRDVFAQQGATERIRTGSALWNAIEDELCELGFL